MSKRNYSKYIDVISKLPQSRHITEEAALKWIDRTLKVDPDRIDWHIGRAGGFGGSEMGALVASMEGRPSRMTPRRLMKQKLLQLSPDYPDVDMKRGIQLEDHVKKRYEDYLDRMDVDWVDLTQHMAEFYKGSNPQHKWLRSSPDGVYRIDGHVYIVDFKAPMPDVLTSYKRYQNFEDYRIQLHHYNLDASTRGFSIDGLALAMYDYKSDDVALFDVEYNPEMERSILNAGDYYWNRFLLRGELPDVDLDPMAIPEDGIPDEIEEAAASYIGADIVAKKASAQAQERREFIEIWVKNTGHLGDARLKLADFLEVKGKPTLDCEAAADRLSALGWSEDDLNELRNPAKYDNKKIVPAYDEMRLMLAKAKNARTQGKEAFEEACADMLSLLEDAPLKELGGFDPDKVREALVSCNEDPEFFYKETLSTGLERRKNPQLDRLKEEIEDTTFNLVESLSGEMRRDDTIEMEGPQYGMKGS